MSAANFEITALDKIADLDKTGPRTKENDIKEVAPMLRTLILLVPLLACPFGMLAMMGLPALLRRARGRHSTEDPPALPEAIEGGVPSPVS